MQFELLANFLLFCVGQTLVLLGILSQKKFRKKPNRILQSFLSLLIIFYLLSYFQTRELVLSKAILTALSQPLELGIVILFFSYCKSLVGINKTEKQLLWAKRLSFLIAFGWLFFTLSFHWFSPNQVEGEFHAYVSLFVQFIVRIWYVLLPVILLSHMRHNRTWKAFLFTSLQEREAWVRLNAFVVIIHGLFRVAAVLFASSDIVSIVRWIDLALFTIISYLFTYLFISAPESIYSELKKGRFRGGSDKKTRFSQEEIQNFSQRLDALMQKEKLYLDSELNLNDLSERMALSVHQLSELINQGHDLNFNDYINQFRVEEFKNLLLQNRFANDTLLAIAFEAGFNSKTTFNTSFKKFTGLTPSQYKRSLIS
jgi:AraC-like DNA-binding protein